MHPRRLRAASTTACALLLCALSAEIRAAVEEGVPGLPPPSEDGQHSSTLDLSEKLGPIIVNSDGTTARIANWAELTPAEQERTRKRIVERNRRRIAALRGEEL